MGRRRQREDAQSGDGLGTFRAGGYTIGGSA
jgi:hypothetical protein